MVKRSYAHYKLKGFKKKVCTFLLILLPKLLFYSIVCRGLNTNSVEKYGTYSTKDSGFFIQWFHFIDAVQSSCQCQHVLQNYGKKQNWYVVVSVRYSKMSHSILVRHITVSYRLSYAVKQLARNAKDGFFHKNQHYW